MKLTRALFFCCFALLLILAACNSVAVDSPFAASPEASAADTLVLTQAPTLTPIARPEPIRLTVKVTDEQGLPVAQAAVRLLTSGLAGGFAGWTNEAGSIEFSFFGEGNASVAVQALSFLPASVEGYMKPGGNQLGIALETNPETAGSNFCRPEDVYFSARHMKMDLYKSLETPPDFIILGSSRAYTLSPAYIEQLTGASGFNATLEGGSILDAYFYAQYFLSTESGANIKLFLVELQINTVDQYLLTGITPIEVWSLMPDDEVFQPLIDLCDHIFSLEKNQDYLDGQRYTGGLLWAFDRDGTARHRVMNEDQYAKAVQRQIDGLSQIAQCRTLAPVGLEYIEKLVILAKEHQVKIVFFRPPYSKAVFDQIENEPQYQACSSLMNDYMQALDAQNEHVLFEDLSDYQPFVDLGFDGFFDAQHFRAETSNQIIDLLLAKIQETLD